MGNPAGAAPLSPVKSRTVTVRHKLPTPPQSPSQSPRKTVLVARRINPGESLQLYDGSRTVSLPSRREMTAPLERIPGTMMAATAAGAAVSAAPRVLRDVVTGGALDRSVLGPATEFEQMLATQEVAHGGEYAESLRSLTDNGSMHSFQQDDAARAEFARNRAPSRVDDAKLSFTQWLLDTKEERAIERWNEQCADWDRFKAHFSERLGKDVDELVLSKSEQHREQLEEMIIFEKAKPSQRGGDQGWQMSLRNAFEAFVPIGNIMSGLFAPLKDNDGGDAMKNFVRVSNPRRRTQQLELLTTKSKVPTDWRDGEYYAKQKKRFGRFLDEVNPHEPEFQDLAVVGLNPLNTQPMLGGTAQYDNDMMAQDGLQEDVRQEEPEQLQLARAGSSERAGGPLLELSSAHVLLEAAAGEMTTTNLVIKNNGSTALYFGWRKLDHYNVVGAEEDGVQRIVFAAPSGVVLPGQEQAFTFSFRSASAGQWSEEWELSTKPPLPQGALAVLVKGVALEVREVSVPRARLEATLAGHLEATQTLERLAVEAEAKTAEAEAASAAASQAAEQAAAPAAAGAESEDALKFDQANLTLRLFYSADVVASMRALAELVGAAMWDLSVESLFNAIDSQEGAEESKGEQLQTLAALVKAASNPPSSSKLNYAICYEVLCGIVAPIVDAAESTRAKMQKKYKDEGYFDDPPPAEEAPPAADADAEGTADAEEAAEAEPAADAEPAVELTTEEKKAAKAAEKKKQRALKECEKKMHKAVAAEVSKGIDAFESLAEAGETQSRLVALSAFGLLPEPEPEPEQAAEGEGAAPAAE